MSIAQKHTFFSLLETEGKNRRILIPKIQRDFAQGREDKASTEIRNRLVGELIAAIAEDAPTPQTNIDLGLIFGAADENTGIITLFDGQQRMTTLFLLQWYLAWRLGKKDACAVLGRFSYDTRLFARDFCRALVNEAMEKIPSFTGKAKSGEIGKRFAASSWYSASWQTDPSVKGMIVMLETIHKGLQDETRISSEYLEEFWERIRSRERVHFTWLLMKELGLNADLYIKLNSRGKPLSTFEKFKAWLEDNERGFSNFPDEWKHKLDSEWTDLFWKRLDPTIRPEKVGESMSNVMMGFFLGNSLNEILATCQKIPSANGESKDGFSKLIEAINSGAYLSRADWERVFQPQSIKVTLQLMAILKSESICADITEWINEANIFKFTEFKNSREILGSVLSGWLKAQYTERLLLYGLARYLTENIFINSKEIHSDSSWNQLSFIRWMRMVRNLAVNSGLSAANFANAIRSISAIAPNRLNELDLWLEEGNEIPKEGLDTDQRAEEHAKAKLRCSNFAPNIEAAFQKAEDHWFLRGQIHFLIELSKIEGEFQPETFHRNFQLLAQHFEGAESNPVNRIRTLQKALLTQSDYLLNFSSKYGFGWDWNEWRTVFKNKKETNWNGLLKLFEKWEIYSLEEIIARGRGDIAWTDWRRWFLEEWPVSDDSGVSEAALDFCQKSRIAWDNEGERIVLVWNVAFGSSTPELRTHCMFNKHLRPRQNTIEPRWQYEDSLRHNSHAFFKTDQWRLELRYPGDHPRDTGFELRLLLKDGLKPSAKWLEIPSTQFSKLSEEEKNLLWTSAHHQLVAPDPDTVNSVLQDALRELENRTRF